MACAAHWGSMLCPSWSSSPPNQSGTLLTRCKNPGTPPQGAPRVQDVLRSHWEAASVSLLGGSSARVGSSKGAATAVEGADEASPSPSGARALPGWDELWGLMKKVYGQLSGSSGGSSGGSRVVVPSQQQYAAAGLSPALAQLSKAAGGSRGSSKAPKQKKAEAGAGPWLDAGAAVDHAASDKSGSAADSAAAATAAAADSARLSAHEVAWGAYVRGREEEAAGAGQGASGQAGWPLGSEVAPPYPGALSSCGSPVHVACVN